MTIIGTVITSDNPYYSIHDLSSTAGIYYEKIAEVHFYDQSWKLITYLNTSYLNYRQKLVLHYNTKIDKICKSQKDSLTCNKLLPTLQHRIPILENAHENLLSLIGHKNFNLRRKRGLLNIIGSGLKSLFGTMDENDAEYIKEAISNLEQNQKGSLTILQDQTTILSNTVNNFNESIMNLQRTEIQINKAIKEVNYLTEQMQNELNHTLLGQYTIQLIDYLNTLIIETEIDLNNLINTVMFTKTGQIHPLVIPIKIFLSKLRESQESLPSGSFFPVALKQENMHLILEISEIVSYLQGDILVFIIKVPITNQETFELFNLIPIPQKENLLSNTVMINPKRNYLFISKTKNSYILSDDKNKNCKNLGQEKICKSTNFLNPYINGVCETELLIKNKMLDCDLRTLKNDIEIWHKLEKQNSWLYTITRPTTLTINCEKLEDVPISGTGTFTLKNKKCRGSTIYHTLVPDLDFVSYYTNKIVTKDLLIEDCCEVETLKYVNGLQPIDTIKVTDINLKELSETAHKINVAKGKISDILSRPNPIHHFSILTYTVAGLIVLVVIFFCWKCSNGGKLCLKLCLFNKWFSRDNANNMPVVTFTPTARSIRARQIDGTNTPVPNRNNEYRFDL